MQLFDIKFKPYSTLDEQGKQITNTFNVLRYEDGDRELSTFLN
jgi:hypothetical protein